MGLPSAYLPWEEWQGLPAGLGSGRKQQIRGRQAERNAAAGVLLRSEERRGG